MKKSVFFGALAATTLVSGMALAGTLADVKARGELLCGSNTGLTGFGNPDASGNWSGFDVDLCRAVAAAVLGDPTKAREKLGWQPTVTARELCAEMVAADLKIAQRHALLKAHGHEVPVAVER